MLQLEPQGRQGKKICWHLGQRRLRRGGMEMSHGHCDLETRMIWCWQGKKPAWVCSLEMLTEFFSVHTRRISQLSCAYVSMQHARLRWTLEMRRRQWAMLWPTYSGQLTAHLEILEINYVLEPWPVMLYINYSSSKLVLIWMYLAMLKSTAYQLLAAFPSAGEAQGHIWATGGIWDQWHPITIWMSAKREGERREDAKKLNTSQQCNENLPLPEHVQAGDNGRNGEQCSQLYGRCWRRRKWNEAINY